MRELDKAIAQWTPQQREAFELNGSRIVALYASGQIDAGIAAAEALVKRKTARTGENSFDTAAAHGMLAVGYARAGRDADAIREFKAAIPVLMAAARENADDDDPTLVVGAQRAAAAHRRNLYRRAGAQHGECRTRRRGRDLRARRRRPRPCGAAGAGGFERAHGGQGPGARRTGPHRAGSRQTDQRPARRAQQSAGVAVGPARRSERCARINAADRETARRAQERRSSEIKRQFPAYADLVDPKPPTVDEIKAALRPGEALLSFYFGQDASFVWAVPKDGAVAFAAVPVTAVELEAKVRRLRQALEPQVTMVAEIPPFDLALAYELYASLLKPVEAALASLPRA